MNISKSIIYTGGCPMCGGNENNNNNNNNNNENNNDKITGGCGCTSTIIHGGLEYVVGGWFECEYNKRNAERKYSNKLHYDNHAIDEYDVIISIIGGSKKITNKNLLKESALHAAKFFKKYENNNLFLQNIYETKLIPKISSDDLIAFAESEIQQNDPDTIVEIYNSVIHLANFLKIKIKKIPLIKIPKLLASSPIDVKNLQAVMKLEKKMLPYIKKIEQNQIILINLFNNLKY